MITEPFQPPEISAFPSGEKTTQRTLLSWSESVAMHDPSLVLHNRTVWSSDADAMYFPHGEKQAVQIPFSCPSSDSSSMPVYASQIFIVFGGGWFLCTVNTRFPSGENARSLVIQPGLPVPHSKTTGLCSPPVSRISTTPVADEMTKRVLVGLNAAVGVVIWLEAFGWINGVRICHPVPDATSQMS